MGKQETGKSPYEKIDDFDSELLVISIEYFCHMQDVISAVLHNQRTTLTLLSLLASRDIAIKFQNIKSWLKNF